MTALSLDLMDITKDWVSSFVMLCQAFTATATSVVVCLCVFLLLVLSSASEKQLNQVEIRIFTWPSQNIPFFY